MKFKYKIWIVVSLSVCAALFTYVTNDSNQYKALSLLNKSEIEALATNPEGDYKVERFCMKDALLPENVTLTYNQVRETSYGVNAGYNNPGFSGAIEFHYITSVSEGQEVTFNMLRCCIFDNVWDNRCDFAWETDHGYCIQAVGEGINERYQAYKYVGILN